jgi:hypothetical protein
MNDDSARSRFNRRQFLIALEGAIGLTIAGVIVAPRIVDSIAQARPASAHPALLDCLQLRLAAQGADLYDISATGQPALVCSVNQVGGAILERLDGRSSVDTIVTSVLRQLGQTSAQPDAFGGKVAIFIAELAQAGFLKEPFYVNVVEETFVS